MKKTFTAKISFWKKEIECFEHRLTQSSLSLNLQSHFSAFHIGNNQDLHGPEDTKSWIYSNSFSFKSQRYDSNMD